MCHNSGSEVGPDPVPKLRNPGVDSRLAAAADPRAGRDDAPQEHGALPVPPRDQRSPGVTVAGVLTCNWFKRLE